VCINCCAPGAVNDMSAGPHARAHARTYTKLKAKWNSITASKSRLNIWLVNITLQNGVFKSANPFFTKFGFNQYTTSPTHHLHITYTSPTHHLHITYTSPTRCTKTHITVTSVTPALSVTNFKYIYITYIILTVIIIIF